MMQTGAMANAAAGVTIAKRYFDASSAADDEFSGNYATILQRLSRSSSSSSCVVLSIAHDLKRSRNDWPSSRLA